MPNLCLNWTILKKSHSGLGVGTAATALTKHGVTPTVVEIDPAVYNASLTWFGLPKPAPERVFLLDGRRVVRRKLHERTNQLTEEPLYDYVIHDCFSGGGVPAHLYTTEFWGELKGIMKPDGVVAVVSHPIELICPVY